MQRNNSGGTCWLVGSVDPGGRRRGAGGPSVVEADDGESRDYARNRFRATVIRVSRWYEKANAWASGWRDVFGALPSKTCVVLGLSVAEHETRCGDAWPGERNWGAVVCRGLTDAEKAVLHAAGVHASGIGDHGVAAARAALQAATLAGTIPEAHGVALHADSAPGVGWYFTMFCAFPNDEEGAKKLVEVLAEERPSCRAILVGADDPLAATTPLAAAMYRTHYYTGFHDPHQPGGADANVADYSAALTREARVIGPALAAWTFGETAAPIDLATWLGVQEALNALGENLVEDGIAGPKTRAAVKAYQASRGLVTDGKVGPKTRGALERDLTAAGAAWVVSEEGTVLT